MITQIKKTDYTDKSCQNNLCNLSEICVIFLYDFIFLIFTVLYLPYFILKGKFHRGAWQRFGFLPEEVYKTPNPAIWLHAVSVGEVAALKFFWRRLREEFPLNKIIISTVTKRGNELARQFAKKDEIVFYLPLDFSFIINRFLEKLRPRALIIVETELWPNLVAACHKKAIPIILVNGRISDKAYPRYKLVKSFLGPILEKIDFICVRSGEDKRRFISLGAPSKNIRIAGNMKYDIADYTPACRQAGLPARQTGILKTDYTDAVASPEGAKQSKRNLRLKLNIRDREKIFVAGSTHKGEEEIVLEVFKKLMQDFKDLHLIIAPRHVERADEIKKIIKNLPVTVIDKIGALQDVYSISDIVFVGGSLVPHGGHNIIEPAVFGKPIIFGPYMFNFQDEACEFLKGDAVIMVKDKNGLEQNCRQLLLDEGWRAKLGENAKRVVSKNQGAVENCICEVKRVLSKTRIYADQSAVIRVQ